TQSSVPHPGIRIFADPGQRPGALPQVGLQFFSVEKGVVSSDNAPFHQQSRGAGDEGGGKGGSGKETVASSGPGSLNVYPGSRQIRLGAALKESLPPAGEGSVGGKTGIVGACGERPACGGWNG